MDGTARTLSYGYDADGNAIALSSSAGPVVQRQYDGADRIAALRWGAYRIAAFGYDAAGHRSSLGFGIDTVTSSAAWTYDGAGRLQTLASDFAGTSADRTLTFAYNPASQIVGRTISNEAYVANSAYDVSRSYSVNGLNQYTTAGSATFTYDLNGNLTGDGTLRYVYDAENRLVSAARTVSGVTTTVATLSYDPHGRLWQVTGPAGTRRLVYDGDRLVEEYDPWSLTAVYVHGPGADEPLMSWDAATGWARRYLHADHQGSIVALADDDGNAASINAYDEWGIPNATNQGRFGYTGQAWLPELGMWYYKARIYSPTLGRFLQTDPVAYDGGINLYEYVDDDPLDRTDPSGENGWDIVHGVLTAASFCPSVCGSAFSAVDAGIYLAHGDRAGAAISGGAAVAGLISDAGAVKLAALGVRHVANAAREVRAARLAANAARGAHAEAITTAKLGNRVAGRQVTFVTSSGKRTRADFVTRDRHVVETKSGGGQLTGNQRELHADIAAGREVTPVGKRAEEAGLRPGKPTQMSGCHIDRPC